MQQRTGRNLSDCQFVDSKPLQRVRPEVVGQQFIGKISLEYPVVYPRDVEVGIGSVGVALPLFRQKQLGRLQARQKLGVLVVIGLCQVKFSRRHIGIGNGPRSALPENRHQIVVPLMVEKLVGHCGSRRYNFGDLAFDDLTLRLRLLGVLRLLANRNTITAADELRQVAVECMERKARQRCLITAVISAGKRYSKLTAHGDGVVGERLIKIADPEQ